MNKNIKLAVAGAVLALSASANAGIIIPAGEWTMDISGNVNAFGSVTKGKGVNTSAVGGIATPRQGGQDQAVGINTGLLPAFLSFKGTTRQNDLDVEFLISFQPNVSNNTATGDGLTDAFTTQSGSAPYAVGTAYGTGTGSAVGNRQTYVSFGDKSWGSIKLGKDLGVFASDAILNDMTLLGVGGGSGTSGAYANTTLGGIGTGYLYAAWKGQIAYTTPNFNGFQATVALTNPNQNQDQAIQGSYQDRFGVEGKASYSFASDALTGKVWVSGLSYDATTSNTTNTGYTATAADIGANINANGFGLTGYYYKGEGIGTTLLGLYATSAGVKRDSDGGYVQATYVLPTKTKIGIAYGVSNVDRVSVEATTNFIKTNDRITVGAYHPLTKHLNLVAEYNDIESELHNGGKGESQAASLGAILFF
jgi:predicted porin